MIALWIALGIIGYIVGWFITARLGYYILGDAEFIFAISSISWLITIWAFLPWAIAKKIFSPETIRLKVQNLQDFVCKGPKAYHHSKFGL